MKTLNASIAALALLSGGALAQTPTQTAIDHFNQDRTGNARIERHVAPAEQENVKSSRSGGFADTVERFNAERSGNDRIRSEGRVSFSGSPVYGADLIEQLRAEAD